MFKAATAIATLLGITLIVMPKARADVLICNNEHLGATEAHIVIPPDTRASFIRYVESGFPDHHFGLIYNGGVGYKDSITLDLSDERSGSIGVIIESKAPNSEFTAWIQTCNTRSSWKPYWKALIHALRAFPGAEVTETPLSPKDLSVDLSSHTGMGSPEFPGRLPKISLRSSSYGTMREGGPCSRPTVKRACHRRATRMISVTQVGPLELPLHGSRRREPLT